MGWVGTVLAAAERLGVAREPLLAQAGIALDELAAERWPIDHITRLWRAAIHCTQDAGFGLKAGAGWTDRRASGSIRRGQRRRRA